MRVWKDGAFAAAALDAELHRHPKLDPRDVGLTTELVYGVLRTTGPLEERIAEHAKQDRWRKQPWLRAHLCIAAYSLLALDRVPDHAAVDEAVEAVKRRGGTKVAGFANAILRRVAKGARLDPARAAVDGLPRWLSAALVGAVGEAGRDALVQGVPPTALYLRAERDREAWVAKLQEAAPRGTVEVGALSPRAILLRGAGDPTRLPGAGEDWWVQEEGAQVVAQLVDAQAGDEVLDACAGRGGKTRILLEAGATVDATDLHGKKLARLGDAPTRRREAVDWGKGPGALAEARYDRILVDAPCTGTGTLRHRPEIATRLRPTDLTRLTALQTAIVRNAAQQLRPGGRLFYAVCSVLQAEGEGVLDAVCRGDETLVPAAFTGPQAHLTTGGVVRLSPHEHGTDGFFVGCLERRP